MASLQHPNIVRLFGIMLNPLRMLIEFCEAGDLFNALQAKRIGPAQLQLRIAYDVALGMQLLHSCRPPLAHRDLRSPNILLVSLEHRRV
jgi:serine/threonine protein kinase